MGTNAAADPLGTCLRSAVVIYRALLPICSAWKAARGWMHGLAEVRRLLDDEKPRGRGVLAERVGTVTAYRHWSADYDAEAGGGLSLVASYKLADRSEERAASS